jgi:hypothetical protein
MLAACSYSSSDEAYFFFNFEVDKLVWQSSSASYGMYKLIDYLEIQMLGII